MSIQDQIAADQAAVDAAAAALATANAQLTSDEAKLAAIAPHLSLLDQIEAELASVEDGVEDSLRAGLDAIKANISPLIAQMRALFNQ
jgi:hypothetical protein